MTLFPPANVGCLERTVWKDGRAPATRVKRNAPTRGAHSGTTDLPDRQEQPWIAVAAGRDRHLFPWGRGRLARGTICATATLGCSDALAMGVQSDPTVLPDRQEKCRIAVAAGRDRHGAAHGSNAVHVGQPCVSQLPAGGVPESRPFDAPLESSSMTAGKDRHLFHLPASAGCPRSSGEFGGQGDREGHSSRKWPCGRLPEVSAGTWRIENANLSCRRRMAQTSAPFPLGARAARPRNHLPRASRGGTNEPNNRKE